MRVLPIHGISRSFVANGAGFEFNKRLAEILLPLPRLCGVRGEIKRIENHHRLEGLMANRLSLGTQLLLVLAGTVVTAAAITLGIYYATRPPQSAPPVSDDPRLAYSGPYRNVHPDVQYVGDAV